jgi:hypothetical protein
MILLDKIALFKVIESPLPECDESCLSHNSL